MNEGWPKLFALRAVCWGLAALLLFLGVATLRAVLDGERELGASDAAFDNNDLQGAIEHARRAASAYAPGAPHVERSYERLLAIARGAEAAGLSPIAMQAYQAERAAVLESASFWQPFPERLEEADRNLSRLAAAKLGPEAEQAGTARRLFERSRTERSGRSLWGAGLAGGWALLGLGLGSFASRALAPGGGIAWASGRWGLFLFGLGLALWAVATLRG
jgi:hypothetical protein